MAAGQKAQWTIEAPTNLDFDDVTGLRIRLIAGSVAVLATDGRPSLDVSSIEGDPLTVTYEGGVLTITHENLTWEGLLSLVRGQVIHSAAIPVNESGSLLAWFEFARHLHDICKRVVFRQIGYAGTYAATNVLYTGQYEVDRVKASMTEKRLGYTNPPVPLRRI